MKKTISHGQNLLRVNIMAYFGFKMTMTKKCPQPNLSPKNVLFQGRFKPSFDTAKRKIAARALQIFRNY